MPISRLWRGSSVIELRQYTLVPNRREVLIDLFEREFIQPQEDLGMRILGQFRSPSRPDLFVWLRGFPDMASRPDMLMAFYGGAVWARHRDEANSTMVDSDNVVLLNPVAGDDRTPVDPSARIGDGELAMTVQPVVDSALVNGIPPVDESPARRVGAAAIMATFVSEPAPNNFERLPVRADGPFVAALSTGPVPARRVAEDCALWPGAVARGGPEVIDLVPTRLSVRRSRARDSDAPGDDGTW